MKKDDFDFVSAEDLRIGLFVDLDLGWMDHPFASGRFKISSDSQISVLKGLSAERFRYIPSRSEFLDASAAAWPELVEDSLATTRNALELAAKARQVRQHGEQALEAQQQAQAICERRFNDTVQCYSKALELLHSQPAAAATLSQSLVQALVVDIQQQGGSALRLLAQAGGDKSARHPVNVTVMSLLLGQAMELPAAELQDLGVAALLHDMGKQELPARLRRPEDSFSAAERNAYQSHVDHSVRLAESMGLSAGTVQAIAQHHEMADGSGFPAHLKRASMGCGSCILALVNRYDGLCNPTKPGMAMTPHEALALLFSTQKSRFDASVLSAFIRMVGVYPPGSVVQLNDERHAMVVAVNAARPLKPRVIVHEPGTPRREALVLDLESVPNASIRRSLRPASLPTAVQDYLQPGQHICYFFESAADARTLVVGG